MKLTKLEIKLLVFLFTAFHIYGENNVIDSQNIIHTEKVDAFSVVGDLSSDIVKNNSEEDEKTWKSYIKNNVTKNVIFSVSTNEDCIYENENLLGAYFYDKDKILHKQIFAKEKIKVPHSIIHSNFVKLLQIGKKNIYVSSLFSVNQKCLYFIAKHLSDGYIMFLFSLPLDFFPAENFILFDEKGQKLLNIGFPLTEVRKVENILKNNLNNFDTLKDDFDDFSIIESNSLMYFYTK